MRIRVNEKSSTVEVLPAIISILPKGLSAWISRGSALIFEGDVEIARVQVAGMSPAEAASEVAHALKGVI